MPKRVIIDTDPGVDDTVAILLALASPELQVDALTAVYGNGSMAQCASNARRILAVAGRSDIPVYRGAEGPLLRRANEGWAWHIHGGDALGGRGLYRTRTVARCRIRRPGGRAGTCPARAGGSGRNYRPGARPYDQRRAGVANCTANR